MSQRLRRLASTILGLSGGGIGILWAYVLYSSYWGDFGPFLSAYSGSPLVAGSIIGLAGAGLYPWARRLGGTLLLVGGIVASPVSLLIETPGAITDPGALLILGVFLAPGILAAFLLFLAGLLSFRKTRHIIKILHDGGWIP